MPIYEYRCRSCEQSFEKLVRVSTPNDSIECPECGARDPERLLSAFSTGGYSSGLSGGSSGGSSCSSSGFG